MKTPVMTSKSGGKAPLCKVCGDESSGFHYGVDSCEGCKGFFRRCITQGMNHKCANEEKCDITPFTRNSCQYCRLKKCFEVGMSREASRLGRRPKRLKEVGGDGGSSTRSHTTNLPIAPYPTPQELYRLRMAELQKLLQANGTFKAELMQAFLSAAKASFQEHSKSSSVSSGQSGNKGHSAQQTVQQLVDVAMLGNINQLFDSGANKMQASSASSTPSCSTDTIGGAGANAGGGGGGGGSLPPSDSPSSLHSPSDSFVELSNMTALDNFLFDQQLPGTPGSGQQNSAEASPDLSHLQSLNSPLNLNNINLDVASPLSDLDLGSPLMLPTASPVFNSSSNYAEPASHAQINGSMHSGATSSVCMVRQSQQQYQKQKAPLPANPNTFQIKTEPQPASPDYTVLSPSFADANSNEANDVAAIMEEVRQTPSDTRRLLIQQVTDAVIEAHFATCINTYKNVEEANKKIMSQKDVTGLPDMSRLSLCASSMWQQFISCMVPEITKVVKFCKKLPGFSEIDQDDQIRLIKQGSFEVLVARFSILVDFESQEMLDPTHSMRSPRKVIRAMPMGEFLDEFFYMAAKFNPLRLTDAEIGLFTSVLIISPGRKGLANKRAVSKIQELYLQALYYLMKHNSPDGDSKFMKLMSLIPMFQRINDEHFKALNNIRMKSPEEFEKQFPDLHREIYDGNM